MSRAARKTAGVTRRRHVLSAVLVLILLVLAGCSAHLPTDHTPQRGLPVDVQPRRDLQRLLPPPQPGASPTEIVGGFIRANVGFADDEDVARRYLTESLARAWAPTSSVVVLSASPMLTESGPGTVSAQIQVSARIDEQGRMVEQPSTINPAQEFTLTRVEGQWRISSLPENYGLWLSAADLDRAFRASTVFYLNPHHGTFVPDVRWLAMGEGLTTALTRAQLAPVPAYLEGAVRTAVTEGLRLVAGAVPVDPTTRTATVNLQGTGIIEDQARDLRAQLGHALLGLSGVSAVDVQVAGRSLEVDGDSSPVTAQTTLPYRDAVGRARVAILRLGESLTLVDPAHYDLRNRTEAQLDELGLDDLDLPNIGMSWTGLAASSDLRDLAAVSSDGTSLRRWRGGEIFTNSGIGDQLTAPSFGADGSLWVAGVARSDGSPRLWVVDQTDLHATARPLDSSVLRVDDRILQIRTSPDGARLLMVLGRDRSTVQRLVVAGIVRDSDGRPFGLSEPMSIAPSLQTVLSARWANVHEIYAVGARREDSRPVAFRVRIGGWLRQLGRAQVGLVDIYAVPTGEETDVRIRTDDGRFHVSEGAGWYSPRNGDDLVLPGT